MLEIPEDINLILKPLEKEIKGKKKQMQGILLLTEAINQNVSAIELFELFRKILKDLFQLRQIVLIHRYKKDLMVYKSVDHPFYPKPYLADIEAYDYKQDDNEKQTKLYRDWGYEKIVKVYHKKSPLAYLLFKGEVNNIETYGFLKTLTNIIAVAIENKRLYKENIEREKHKKEMELARQVQGLLVPNIFPESPEIKFATTYIPHNEVSGDYYDYISLDKHKVLFCIADVAGKGVPAAILMANLQASLRRLAIQFKGLIPLIKQLNKIVYKNTKGERFITMFLATYDSKTDRLVYLNAGHNPPVLHVGGQSARLLKTGSTVLGIVPQLTQIEEESITIENESILLMYTDGVTERENQEGIFFGEKRVLNFVQKNSHLEPEEFNNLLIDNINTFSGNGESKDDITIFSCCINPRGII